MRRFSWKKLFVLPFGEELSKMTALSSLSSSSGKKITKDEKPAEKFHDNGRENCWRQYLGSDSWGPVSLTWTLLWTLSTWTLCCFLHRDIVLTHSYIVHKVELQNTLPRHEWEGQSTWQQIQTNSNHDGDDGSSQMQRVYCVSWALLSLRRLKPWK